MTELSVKINDLYKKYAETASGPRKRSFSELFKGWITGEGKQTLPIDTEFMSLVEELTDKIKEEGDGDDALSASLLILSKPESRDFSEQNTVYAAMYKNIIKLIPKLSRDDAAKVTEAADRVPKQYRFPVYKDLRKALFEISETQN